VGNVFDVTEQKRVEQALAEANRRKDEFLSMLAHELRNPLAPIRNAVALMRLQSARSPEFTGVCELLDRNVLQLVRLVDDLLDVSRISHGKIRVERNQVDIRAVIEQAVEISKPLLDARSHRLTVHGMEAPVRVLGDLTRLTQVVANLLNNAAKYTDPGGQVAVYVDRVDAEAVIRVRDTGIGLPADKLESVFEPFTQMEPTRERSEGGLGIGLTLARRLVELHGGRLSASSEGPGLGSEFTVRLPMASNAATPDPEAPAASQTPRRVLVADDNVDAAEKLARLVRGQGHEVRVAHNGPAALKAADSFQPELIVLDVGLPEMNGYEVARRLRRQPGLAAATLVAISTNGQCDDGSRCRDAGFDRHLVKPVDAEAIRLVLAHVGQQD
jgi:CheY-like chemotaxis protein